MINITTLDGILEAKNINKYPKITTTLVGRPVLRWGWVGCRMGERTERGGGERSNGPASRIAGWHADVWMNSRAARLAGSSVTKGIGMHQARQDGQSAETIRATDKWITMVKYAIHTGC